MSRRILCIAFSGTLRALNVFIRGAVLMMAASYLFLALVCTLPNNPLQHQLYPISNVVVGRFFSQGWAMFAPTPAASREGLWVRCLASDRATQWKDILSPLAIGARSNPFSADLRLASYLLDLTSRHVALERRWTKLKSSLHGDDVLFAELQERREIIQEKLSRVGSIACQDIEPKSLFSQVQLKVIERPVRPWSKRNKDPLPEVETSLGTFPFAADVERAGLSKP